MGIGVIHLANSLKRSWLFYLVIGLTLILFGLKLSLVHAQDISISSPRNCDDNAVIWCGAGSTDSLISKYNNGDGHNTVDSIHDILSSFGISSSDINSMSSASTDVEAGTVSKSGNVFDGSDKLVATDALTGGRQDISGSTKEVSGGTTFFVRPPSISFVSSPLAAFVVMQDGRFAFAILVSCGNPVKATPVAPAPTPKPKPMASTPTPTTQATPTTSVNQCSNVSNDTISQSGNCNTTVTNVQQAQAASPTGVCSSLAIAVDQTNPMSVTATATPVTSNGAELQNVTFNFGDGTATSVPSTSTSATHTFAQNGTFVVTSTLNFSATQSTTSSICQAVVPVGTTTPTSPITPTPTTPTPSVTTTATTTPSPTLVNTGPGDVFGVFGVTTILGAVGYRYFLTRKFNSTF